MEALLFSDPARCGALVVGVENYEGQGNLRLAGCATASRDFRDWLIDHGVPDEQILMHVCPSAEGEQLPQYLAIRHSIDNLKDKAKDLIVYWASHGYSNNPEHRCVYFGDSFPQLQTLDVDRLLDWLSSRSFGFETVFAVFDCCANRVGKEYELEPIKLPRTDHRDQVAQVYVHFACGIGETAGYTAVGGDFSAILLRELRDRPWPLNVEEFDRGLAGKYRSLANKGQRPIRSYSRTPTKLQKEDFRPSATSHTNDWWGWFRGLFSGFEKKYLRYVATDRSIDIRGLTARGPFDPELERVYVEATLKPVSLHQVSSNPVRRVALDENLRTIWDYLKSPSLSWRGLVLLGGPGTGKSTLLRRVALVLAVPRRQRPLRILPILLSLRRDVRGGTNMLLPQVIHERLAEFGLTPPPRWFQSRLEKGRCLIMLDALDEIASANERKEVTDWVFNQMRLYSGNRFIFTSRPDGYRENPLTDVLHLEVQPFTREQVQVFVLNWYRAFESANGVGSETDVRAQVEPKAAALMSELRGNFTLAELAVNPLMLTMLTEVYQCDGSMPSRRTELYSEICRVFLGRRAKAMNLPLPLSEDQSQLVLESIAWQMMCQSDREAERGGILAIIQPILRDLKRGVSGDLFLRDSHERGGLFVETAPNRHAFAHFSLQEYFAALYAHKHGRGAELISHLREPWWRQTLLFYSAAGNASAVIGDCLRSENPSIDDLTLAVQCLEEATDVTQELRGRIEDIRDLWVDDPSAERRRIAAEVRLTHRMSRMILHDGKYIDSSLITNTEYQLFVEDSREKGLHCEPDHWSTPHFKRGQGSQPVMGARAADALAFCNWLGSWRGNLWSFRLPRDGEIEIPGHWMQLSAGFDCYPPANAFPITSIQLRARFQSDLQQAAKYGVDVSGRKADIGEEQEKLLAALETFYLDVRFVAEFTALVIQGWDYDGSFNFGEAVYGAMQHNLSLEEAWDPELIRMVPILAIPDFGGTEDEETPDLSGGLNLEKAIPRYLDLDSSFGFLEKSELPWYKTADAETELDKYAVRLAQHMDSGLSTAGERILKPRTPIAPKNDADPVKVAEMLRWHLRLRALIAAGLLSGRKKSVSKERARLDRYRGLYVALAILEERINGTAQASEGISIIKEV